MAKLKMLGPALRTMDPRSVKLPPKVALPFYSTPEWISLRDQVRREARGTCQAPNCKARGHIVDHIVEISDGGAKLDRANVMLLCASHHQVKTQRERAKRAGLR